MELQGIVGDAPAQTPVPEIVEAGRRLTAAAASKAWRGPDPFDGLWARWPRPLVAGKRRRQAIIQLHARSPVDIRRVYRRSHSLIPKTLGLFASASIRLWRVTADERFRAFAVDALDTLAGDRSAGEYAWGYPWDTQTRWSFYPAGSPNIVVTAFAAQALRDGAEAFGISGYAERARRSAEWVRSALWVPEARMFAYHEGSTTLIHNASMLGAALVRRLMPGDDASGEAVSTTLAAQAADGSWPYGAGAANLGFVDSFHTGYVLNCLTAFADHADVQAALSAGARYYVERFFDEQGRTLLWPGRPYPEDGHSAGTALSTLASLYRLGLTDLGRIELILSRVLRHVIRGDHVVHRRGRHWRSTVSYVRWCDGHVALGLAELAETLSN